MKLTKTPTMRLTTRKIIAISTAITLLGVTACSTGGAGADSSNKPSDVTLTYALWDPQQQPAYQKCADQFTAKTGINVTIQQSGWDTYWAKLSTDLVAGTGPDVFTNVNTNYPDYVNHKQIISLSPMIEKDHLDLSTYVPVSLTTWQKDGQYYGLPKDVDALGLVYNPALTTKAGLDITAMNSLTWNPTNGGTFEKALRALTVDTSGRNALDPAFDKNNVAVHAISSVSFGDPYGSMDWGNTLLSMDTQLLSPNPFGTTWHYNDANTRTVLSWYKKIADDGLMVPPSLNNSVSNASWFGSGKIALAMDGPWNASSYIQSTTKLQWAKFPSGPAGRRTYSNSLADSINAATKHPDKAWQLVKYLASEECQNTVAAFAVVFPAQKNALAMALNAYTAKGVDLRPILEELNDPNLTVAYPIGIKYTQVGQLVTPALQDIFLNNANVDKAMADVQAKIDALFK